MRYYVYILLDDMNKGNYDNEFCNVNYKPFYVGKGDNLAKNKTKRHLVHYGEPKKKLKKITNLHKFNKIKKLQENGYEPNYLIVYQDDDEKKVLEVEKKLIKYYGKINEGGILTNISDGGYGGNLFQYIDGLRKRLDTINSERWSGKNNPNFNKKKEDTYSHKFKLKNGYHWNNGKKMTDNHKKILKSLRYDNLPIVEMVEPNTRKIVDRLKTVDAIKKYNLNSVLLYRCLNEGGKHKGYYWKYENKELVLNKTSKPDYIKPKRKLKNQKKIYYKESLNDNNEVMYQNITEASVKTGFCEEVIRRKCRKNNTNTKIFRYENEDYKLEIKNGKKIKIVSIDSLGNEVVYSSATEASKKIKGASISAIIQVCKGKRKKHKNLIFKYF